MSITENSTVSEENIELPLISILVPYHNAEAFLERCLKSLVSQTYKNLEIILLNNASTDKGPEIASEYQKKDSRIVLANLEEPGISKARNELLRLAKGQWYCFVDSDDEMFWDSVEKLYKKADELNVDMIVGSHIFRTPNNDKERLIEEDVVLSKEKIHEYFLTQGRYFNFAWGKLYKAELFEGVSYKIGSYYEDIEALPRILENTNSLATIKEKVYIYYRNDKGITSAKDLKVHEDGLMARMSNRDFYDMKYPKLEGLARAGIVEFAFYLLGKIWEVGISQNRELFEKVKKIVKETKVPKESYVSVKMTRLLFVVCPRLTMFLLQAYSKWKNN